MITSLAALKRALALGTVVTLVRREHPPLLRGHDATGIPRRIVRVKSRAIAFESIRKDTDQPSWLYWPCAEEVSFELEGSPGAAQLFTVEGMTYRIEPSVNGLSERSADSCQYRVVELLCRASRSAGPES
ncbi:hypothetical protein ACNUDN_29950 [Mycobacterium sp. smrl_JER01]|uniref:hypothetical protein n=1 Tax=Mycobacterium sp. smrl_JER01 TaxID=3402633 RepID=UPI003AC39340